MCPHERFDIWVEVRQGVCVAKVRVCRDCVGAEILGIDNEWRGMTLQTTGANGENLIAAGPEQLCHECKTLPCCCVPF